MIPSKFSVPAEVDLALVLVPMEDVSLAPLEDVAIMINDEHAKCEAAARMGFAHAMEVGLLLLQVKGRVGHGKWLSWLKENCTFSTRTAQAYMSLAKRPELKCATAAHLTLRSALKSIASPQAEIVDEGQLVEVVDYGPKLDLLTEAVSLLHKALEVATNLKEFVAISDVALQVANEAAEIKLRCERAAGLLLKEMQPTSKGGRP